MLSKDPVSCNASQSLSHSLKFVDSPNFGYAILFGVSKNLAHSLKAKS